MNLEPSSQVQYSSTVVAPGGLAFGHSGISWTPMALHGYLLCCVQFRKGETPVGLVLGPASALEPRTAHDNTRMHFDSRHVLTVLTHMAQQPRG